MIITHDVFTVNKAIITNFEKLIDHVWRPRFSPLSGLPAVGNVSRLCEEHITAIIDHYKQPTAMPSIPCNNLRILVLSDRVTVSFGPKTNHSSRNSIMSFTLTPEDIDELINDTDKYLTRIEQDAFVINIETLTKDNNNG